MGASAVAQTIDEQLATAKGLYDAADLEGARARLDVVIAALEPKTPGDPAVVGQLLKAYELRARTRFNLGDQPGTIADLQTLLRYNPEYTPPTDVSTKLTQLFAQVRQSVVAEIQLAVTPGDAQVAIDGTSVTGRTGRIPVAAGTHKIVASRAGYKTLERSFAIEAGSAQELTIALERSAATVAVITYPTGVEVLVGGVSRGATKSGQPTPGMVDAARAWNVPVAEVSELVVPDLLVGRHKFELRMPCFTPEERTVDITRLDDLTLEPVRLKPAKATLRLEANTPATIFINDVPRGPAPRTLSECEGAHTIEFRSSSGRFLRRIEVKAGEQKTIAGTLKPAFAVLSVAGLPEGIRGVGDLRVSVENALADAARITLFAPAAEHAQQALASQRLSADWLAFDRAGSPLREAAKNITANGFRDLSTELARAIEAQGVAAVTVKNGSDRNELLVSLLAQGSSRPDVVQFRIDDPESIRRALSDLDFQIGLHRASLGLLAMDVQGDTGVAVTVAEVDPRGPAAQAAVGVGSVIVSANGNAVTDAAALERFLEKADPERKSVRVSLELRDAAGAAKKVDVPVIWTARAISQYDQTLLFNPLLVSLRHQLASGALTVDEPVLRLNIAIALMNLGNWTDARTELDRIHMGDGRGVGQGTVNYLLGLCYEALGQFADAARAWTAAKGSDATLTEDGPRVKDLATAKLSKLSTSAPGDQ